MLAKQFLALASLITLAMAAPAAEVTERSDVLVGTPIDNATVAERGLDKRGSVTIIMFGGDGCTGQQHSIVQNSGTLCYPVPAGKRSIHGVGDCRITTWSGRDCRGSSAFIPTTSCINVLYGSVLVEC